MLLLKKWTVIIVLGLTFTFSACNTMKRWQGKKEKSAEETPDLRDLPKLAQMHIEGKAHPIDVHKLDTFVTEAVKKTGIPGLSIAVVQDGKVVLAKGYGTTELGGHVPVDADTLFAIASTTKPLTSLLVASLVDEGKLHWEDKANHLYPELKLSDPVLLQQLTLEKMMCMCTGIPCMSSIKALFNDTTYSITFKELASLKPTAPFGEEFRYSNQMYAAAGFVAALGLKPLSNSLLTYTKFMTSHLFRPMKMSRTVVGWKAASKMGNIAFPHVLSLDGKLHKSDFKSEDVSLLYAPAAAVWSSANDMAKYLAVELSGGVSLLGKRLFSEENLLRRRKVQVPKDQPEGYGLGLQIGDIDGHQIIAHGGNAQGFNSDFNFFPQDKLGFVILNNTNNLDANEAIFHKILELAFHSESKVDMKLEDAIKNREESSAKFLANRFDLDHTMMASMSGKFHNPELGDFTIKESNGRFSLFTPFFDGVHIPLIGKKSDDGEKQIICENFWPGLSLTPTANGFEIVVSPDEKYEFSRATEPHEDL